MISEIIKKASQQADIAALWLYGSRAKGNATIKSDYDLAVIFSKYEHNPLERRLRPETLALQWSDQLGLNTDQLSILDLEVAPIPLAMEVISTGKLLVNKDPAKEMFLTQKIMSKWELDYQYHYRHYG
ncbi:nucleotidyltransferase domain-containing protein [Parashewanella curva]|uniref:Nucleotidyltransferase domain-containing protein n=1 Tax=Parashewanella curva TaxID=2338552 RepID=A0A3L8PX85_9GAMM|nr:nucleotidyltransferase domain-containing protein [Parashewanella curva]RLV60016.1 nucleotidyltransferase domain-containing protein [Parashewanella curva]